MIHSEQRLPDKAGGDFPMREVTANSTNAAFQLLEGFDFKES